MGRLRTVAQTAVVISLLGLVGACGSAEPGAPPEDGLYDLPSDPCAGLNLESFTTLFGEPAGDRISLVQARTGQCAQAYGGAVLESGERRPGGSVQIFLHRFESTSEARASFQRVAPSPTPTPTPIPTPTQTPAPDPSASTTPTPDGFPAPVTGADDVRYEWTYDRVYIELVQDNMFITVEASSLAVTAPAPVGESPPPDPMLTLPQVVHDLTQEILANLSG